MPFGRLPLVTASGAGEIVILKLRVTVAPPASETPAVKANVPARAGIPARELPEMLTPSVPLGMADVPELFVPIKFPWI